MTDAIKRISKSKDAQFQDRVRYYMWDRAKEILAESTPNTDDLALAKAVYAGQVAEQHMALMCITNTSIGSSIDAGSEVADTDIEWAIKTDNQFHNLALGYKAAGLI